jgi:hypothetical protein
LEGVGEGVIPPSLCEISQNASKKNAQTFGQFRAGIYRLDRGLDDFCEDALAEKVQN